MATDTELLAALGSAEMDRHAAIGRWVSALEADQLAHTVATFEARNAAYNEMLRSMDRVERARNRALSARGAAREAREEEGR